ncbi:hypothetical protein A2U01_0097644, partial [Trifolium medium]|nr:hypothetical protein [Trifolium medium]
MDEQQPQPSTSRPRVDYSWVADEPRYTTSIFVNCGDNIPEGLFLQIQTLRTKDWEVRYPGKKRICSRLD